MFPWLWIWTPQVHFPWSGSVAQRIEPNTNWFFDSIDATAGNGKVEQKVFEVASYGRQLGLITEVLIDLAEQQKTLPPETDESLQRLKTIRTRIDKIKDDETSSLVDAIETQMEQLRRSNNTEYARLCAKMQPLLAGGSG